MARRLLAGDHDARRAAIEHCVRAKARFVAADPDDTAGTRALLNFGHSFGHAIEALAGHALLHGEAVAIGMALAFDFSAELGLCPSADADRVQAHLQAAACRHALPTSGLAAGPARSSTRCGRDKKASGNGVTLILAEASVRPSSQGRSMRNAWPQFLERRPSRKTWRDRAARRVTGDPR